ncbi:MAG: 50S ribosomal protein L4 [Nitrospira sp.]|nr:50S ribosomal protein L4 [Nitrospira sp.]
MASMSVVDQTKTPVGSVDVSESVFGVTPHSVLVHSAVVMQCASLRQGSASTKGRSEVSGTGRKPWKQKQTGRSRVGSNRSPIWRHGGTVFGPRPRRYTSSLSKKMYRKAMQSALSSKKTAGELVILSDLLLPEPKTRLAAAVFNQLELYGTILIVVGQDNPAVFRATRNLPYVKTILPQDLTVYDVLRYETLLVVQDALPAIQELWS